jgi:hypothetical protein
MSHAGDGGRGPSQSSAVTQSVLFSLSMLPSLRAAVPSLRDCLFSEVSLRRMPHSEYCLTQGSSASLIRVSPQKKSASSLGLSLAASQSECLTWIITLRVVCLYSQSSSASIILRIVVPLSQSALLGRVSLSEFVSKLRVPPPFSEFVSQKSASKKQLRVVSPLFSECLRMPQSECLRRAERESSLSHSSVSFRAPILSQAAGR